MAIQRFVTPHISKASLIAALILTSALVQNASAEVGDVSLDPVTSLEEIGDIFSREVLVDVGSDVLSNYTFTVIYEASVVEVTAINGGSTTEFGSFLVTDIDNTAGVARFAQLNTDTNSPTGSVSVANIEFTTLDASSGSSPITLEVSSIGVAPDGDSIATTIIPAGVTVQGPPVVEADLAVTKVASAAEIPIDGQVEYTITISNAGPDTAENVRISDVMPAEISVDSVLGCSGPLSDCVVGSIDANASAQVVVTATAGTLGNYENSVTVQSDADDNDSANDTDAVSIDVIPREVNLAIVKTSSTFVTKRGDTVEYTITVTNNGAFQADDIVVTESIPVGLTFVSSTGCEEDPDADTTCSLGTLEAGESIDYTVTVQVDADALGAYANTVTVSSTQVDSDESDNETTFTVSVVRDSYCEARLLIAMQISDLGSVAQIELEGLPLAASMALIDMQLCDADPTETVPGLAVATETAYQINQDLLEMLVLADPEITDIQEAVAIIALIGSEMQATLLQNISDSLGLTITGPFEIVTESGGVIMPQDIEGVSPQDGYLAFDELTIQERTLSEPYTGLYDLDGDGLSNAEEYNDVVVLGGGSLVEFARAASGVTTSGGGGGGGGSGSGGCFIATAAYGTPLAHEITILRAMRDTQLLNNPLGAAFVDTYYRLSPPVAERVAQNEFLGAIIRMMLVPVLVAARLAMMPFAPLILAGFLLLCSAVLIRRKIRIPRLEKNTMLRYVGRGLNILVLVSLVACGYSGGSGGGGGEQLIAADVTSGLVPLVVNFSAPFEREGSRISTYDWNFGDDASGASNTSTVRAPSHTYEAPGVFTVTLSVTTGDGTFSSTKTDFISVTEEERAPTAFFSSDVTTGPAPLSVSFTDQSVEGTSPIDTWLWNFGDPASGSANIRTDQNPTHNYSAPGLYTVTLTVSTAEGVDTETQVDFINARGPATAPTADFTSDVASGDVPLNVSFTDTSEQGSAPITTWYWNFGDPDSGLDNTSTEQNPSHIFALPGSYSVSLTVVTEDGTDTVTKSDFVATTTILPISNFTADVTSGYLALTVTFTDQSIPGESAITSRLWNFGDPASGVNNASTDQNPTHTYTNPGLYSVSLTVTTAAGVDVFTRLDYITTAQRVTGITHSLPAPGEQGVDVGRKFAVQFDNPLAPGSVIPGTITASFGGQPLDARLHLSADARTASLFFDNEFPASARIRVMIDGDLLQDDAGDFVDADGDGVAGGIGTFAFDTHSATRLSGTAVVGNVSAFVPDASAPGGSTETALEGVSVFIDGAGAGISTTTDALGDFRIDPAPAGRVLLRVDGTTAINTGLPAGAFYPEASVSMEVISHADNDAGIVYLPLVASDALQPVSLSTSTTIALPGSVLSANPDFTGSRITVPADSLFAHDGTRGGSVGLAVGRVPTFPAGVPGFPVALNVQSTGGSNFDESVGLRLPNLSNPALGTPLPASSKATLWEYSDEVGQLEAVGSGTVSADGAFITSDPGAGIRAPGWYGFSLGSSATGGGAKETDEGFEDACRPDAESLMITAGLCAEVLAFIPLDSIPELDCAEGIIANWRQAMIDFIINPSQGSRTFIDTTLEALLGCLPELGGLGSTAFSCLEQLSNDQADLLACMSLDDSNIYEQQRVLLVETYAIYGMLFGSAAWIDFATEDAADMLEFYAQLRTVLDPGSDGGDMVTIAERVALLAAPRASSITVLDVDDLLVRLDSLLQGDLTGLDRSVLVNLIDLLDDTVEELNAERWSSTLDGFTRASTDTAELIARVVDREGGPSPVPLYFRITNLTNGDVGRGRLSSLGTMNVRPLALNSKYKIDYLHPRWRLLPRSFETGSVVIYSGSTGTSIQIPPTYLAPEPGLDTDADALLDAHEGILGSNPLNPDTDGDGIEDGVELQQGTDPLDGLIVPTGVVGTVYTQDTALDVSAGTNAVAVADGSAGVAIYDAFNGLTPIIVAQIDTPGFARAIAYDDITVAVADDTEGLTIIDMAAPGAPIIVAQIPSVDLGGDPHAVAMRGNSIFVATPSGILTRVDGAGNVVDSIDMVDTIEDLSIGAQHLYVVTTSGAGNLLNVLPLEVSPLTVSASAPLNVPAPLGGVDHRWRIFLGTDIAYITTMTEFITVDITDPVTPLVIQENVVTGIAGFRHTVTTGSGRGVVAVGPDATDPNQPSDVELFDTSDPNVTTTSLDGFPTPGTARAVTLLRGLAYIADEDGGLQVIAHQPYDAQGINPDIALVADPAGPSLVPGTSLLVTAITTDDIQVRHVELYVNGVPLPMDGNFPFAFVVPVPLTSETTSLEIAAIATDTGGNWRISDYLNFTID